MKPDALEFESKGFILGAALCFLVIFASAWVYVIKKPMSYNEMAYPIWMQRMQSMQEQKFGTLTILGDSQPMADMMPARLGPGVTNFALPGSMPIESYFIARAIVDSPSLPKAVIISFAPVHFSEKESFWDMAVGFGFLNFDEINAIRAQSRAFKDDEIFGPRSPGDFDARFKALLYSIKFPAYKYAALCRTLLHSDYASNQEMLRFVEANRGRAHVGMDDGSTLPDWNTKLKDFTPALILDSYFNQALAVLQSRNIPVYFLGMPHNVASEHLYFPGLKEKFVTYLNGYAAKYPNFHILDDPFPSYPSNLFGDPDHLNEKGAIQWSDHVAQLLNEHHVEGGPFIVPPEGQQTGAVAPQPPSL
jgi:hypothetical protein